MQPPSVIVPALEREPEIVRLGHLLQRQPVPWIGWNTTDEPALTLAAFTAERVRYFPLP
ncbi:MAG: hypothetical protein H7Z42_09895 [Roseiflexaceae bacterium]|nr:hypothetical protein [Roseiflexaceae bacterium]